MQRCLELAQLATGHVAPNPVVGAVLVYGDRVIGEGYHQEYGKAHAEVNCLLSVQEADISLIRQSTMYVSLEPCAHHGKTPPCADLIIDKKIPRVVVGCRDPFPEVNGKGIEKLRAAGVLVELGILEQECKALNRRFFTFHTLHRPYILLKWAQSSNGRISAGGQSRTLISNEYSNRLVHKWRSQEPAILVGTNTALKDDPALTVRLWSGRDPIRLVVDRNLRLPASLQLFNGQVRTIVFNTVRHDMGEGDGAGNLFYYQLAADSSLVHQIVQALFQLKIQSVLIEGGAGLLQSFIDEGYWDEARVITNDELLISHGLAAPLLPETAVPGARDRLFSDTIRYYTNPLFPW
jgi:diaminohydroxyphosphoribosylaminopyrimidine deaminase / 5-amino-6-(5-phosphoribosylamino)uracil reductase